jgi:hypothetical protein
LGWAIVGIALEQLQQFGKPTWHPSNFSKIRKMYLQQLANQLGKIET